MRPSVYPVYFFKAIKIKLVITIYYGISHSTINAAIKYLDSRRCDTHSRWMRAAEHNYCDISMSVVVLMTSGEHSQD